MKAILIGSVVFYLLTPFTRADLSSMRRYAVTDQFGEYLFVMAPKQISGGNLPHGTAYSVEIDGTMKKLWSVSGWYEEPRNVFLDTTGRYLVRITEPAEMKEVSKVAVLQDKIVLSFYDRGNIIKSYKFKDIVDDVSRGVSFRIQDKTFVFTRPFGQSPKIGSAESIDKIEIPESIIKPHLQVFLLETREGKAFVFDIASGEKIGSK